MDKETLKRKIFETIDKIQKDAENLNDMSKLYTTTRSLRVESEWLLQLLETLREVSKQESKESN